ncbi:MAG: NAD(P)/FAD-dependent oxidoreductase [Lacunisphaera sp.]|nr:NAD(P)/FAD-dependent oxidoreductase [Lacunisphaera sp.]
MSTSTSTAEPTQHVDALIIGSGFSGMYQLLSFRDKLGLSAKVLEAANGVGGTWYWNRYPGARCDSESHSYAYYFSKALIQDWNWSERFPQQPEILRYLNHVADRFDLRRDIQLNTRVRSGRHDQASNRWHVISEAGEHFTATYLVTAVGCLSSANVPGIPGLSDFAGDWYHTGQWPHEGVNFSGKRVGVVGTGSTGIQAIPVIAADAGHLTVFQRTANYSLPARNASLTEEFRRYAKEHSDDIRKVMTSNTNAHPFYITDRSAFDCSDEERKAIFEAGWKKGGLEFRTAFRDLLIDEKANKTAADFIRGKIHDIVKDPKTAALLADIDHPFAAKRPPVDSQYFETYNRDNVSLVNLRETPIERITAKGIQTAAQEFELEIIVFATGFDAMTGSLLKIDIEGRNGMKLSDAWSAGPRNYLGLQVPGFPNFFTITGPGSPSVLCNMPPAIEHHVDWITECIRHMREQGIARIEATESAADYWVHEVNAAASATLLPRATHSWFLGANIPGKPRVFMPYAGGFAKYRQICADVVSKGYEGFSLSRS